MRENPRKDDRDDNLRRPWRDYWGGNGSTIRLGKTTEAITAGTSGGFEFYTGALGSETATGDTDIGYSRGVDLASGIWVNIAARGGGWELFPLECNP